MGALSGGRSRRLVISEFVIFGQGNEMNRGGFPFPSSEGDWTLTTCLRLPIRIYIHLLINSYVVRVHSGLRLILNLDLVDRPGI